MRCASIHISDKPDHREGTLGGINRMTKVFLVGRLQMLSGIKLFPQNHITCDKPELGRSGPFPKEWSLLGDVFLHLLYLPEI
jgi:hypothetical protein